ncbi:methyl-accepting chemotaxis protein [Bdellovibrionota bacterium FG-2]
MVEHQAEAKIVSIPQRISFLRNALIAVGVISIAIYLVSNAVSRRVQTHYQNVVAIREVFGAVKLTFNSGQLAITTFLHDPSRTALWAEKIKADANLDNLMVQIDTLKPSDELMTRFKTVLEMHETVLPLEKNIRSLIKVDPKAAIAEFIGNCLPNYATAGKALDEATDMLSQDLATAAEKLSLINSLSSVLMLTSVILGAVLGVLLSMRLGRAILTALEEVVEHLARETAQTKSEADGVYSVSTKLAATSSQQAAAVQETTASVEELNAMVSKSADNAARSATSSSESSAAVTQGKMVMQGMMRAIEEIHDSNKKMTDEIELSNTRISEIVKMIAEIGDKTKVINDIVFQTKLLSFNASVEAARAGEQGKGFSVVAEEVGNLAKSSGDAAREIDSLLTVSTGKVKAIVEESNTRIRQLMEGVKLKVDLGLRTARESEAVLDKILSGTQAVNQMVQEISSASHEQAQGVSEISKAMTELDGATHSNSKISGELAASAKKLRHQAEDLGDVVQSLESMIRKKDSKTEIAEVPVSV